MSRIHRSARTRLGVEITGAGRHPGAWRRTRTDPSTPLHPAHTVGLVRAAATRAIDLVVLPDTVRMPDGPPARLDAVALAARVAPVVGAIGLVAQSDVTRTGPLELSASVAALDVVSRGRAGWEPVVPGAAAPDALWRELDGVVDAVDRLWESGADPADPGRLRPVDVAGVAGVAGVVAPSAVPRPPQGRPLVVLRADTPEALDVAARRADVVRIAAPSVDAARASVARVRAAVAAAGRVPDDVPVLLDVEVHAGPDRTAAERSLAALDRAGGELAPSTLRVVGPAVLLADLVETVTRAGAADGVTFLPLALPGDLDTITARLVPLLAGRGLFHPLSGGLLRSRFGLARPADRRAPASAAS